MSKVIVIKDWVCQMLAEGLEQSDLDWSWVDTFDDSNLMDAEVILTSPYTPVTREMMEKAKN